MNNEIKLKIIFSGFSKFDVVERVKKMFVYDLMRSYKKRERALGN
jgi:hypothetical protein